MRLVATVTAHLLNGLAAEGPGSGKALSALEVSLVARGTNALSTWLGRPLPDLQLEAGDEKSTPSVEEAADGSLQARALPDLGCSDLSRYKAGLPRTGPLLAPIDDRLGSEKPAPR